MRSTAEKSDNWRPTLNKPDMNSTLTLTLTTVTYDGFVITTRRAKFPSEKSWGATHRRKVRWYLRLNKMCRLGDNHDLTSNG